MIRITQKNSIGGPQLKLIKPTLLESKALTTKSPEMAHSRCSPMHELIVCPLHESTKKNLVPNMARGVLRLMPISPRSLMLIEYRLSHLTKGAVHYVKNWLW
jgi:hypothetical protein